MEYVSSLDKAYKAFYLVFLNLYQSTTVEANFHDFVINNQNAQKFF